MTTNRPKGALAQALYCKLNNDLQMENFDYQSWYRLGKFHLGVSSSQEVFYSIFPMF